METQPQDKDSSDELETQPQSKDNTRKLPSKKPPKPLSVKPKLQLSDKQDSPSVKTDKDSLYRKLYNRSLPFFVWVIEQEPAPYIFKLHI